MNNLNQEDLAEIELLYNHLDKIERSLFLVKCRIPLENYGLTLDTDGDIVELEQRSFPNEYDMNI